MKKRFRALHMISVFYKIAAAVVAVGAILGFVIAIIAMNILWGRHSGYNDPGLATIAAIVGGSGFLIGGLITAVSLYAAANLLDLMLSLEENTRATAVMLQRVNPQSTRVTRPASADLDDIFK